MTKNTSPRLLCAELLETRVLLASDLIPAAPQLLAAHPVDRVDFATIEGIANNLEHPTWGAAGSQLIRLVAPAYADSMAAPSGSDRPSPRYISNRVSAQRENLPNKAGLTDMAWAWGQFVDHDLDLTTEANPHELFPIPVPAGDPYFDPQGTGEATIPLMRSIYDVDTGQTPDSPRQQINQITSYLDGSVIYGSDAVRAAALRTFDGGRLKTSGDDLPPLNVDGLPNAGGDSNTLFLAGDVRANENLLLTSMHTVWIREHNRIAEEISTDHPELSDEEIYKHARAYVTAELQAITYNEFLPALLGQDALGEYDGYDPTVNASISNLFSTSAYRFGHSMLSSGLLRLKSDHTPSDDGVLPLRNAFFAPDKMSSELMDELLLGATAQKAQEIDTKVIDDVRNFLFGPPGMGGFDLVSLNIQRGRDHGLDTYNNIREQLGLARAATFADITSDPQRQQELEAAYGNVDLVDAWVGGLAEDHVPGASVGQLIHTVLVDQFRRIRSGDRLWYQNVYEGDDLEAIEATRLSEVILRNTSLMHLPDDVFHQHDMMFMPQMLASGKMMDVDLGDLDGDGDLDALLSSSDRSGHRILLNESGKLVQSASAIPTPSSRVSTLADVDGDGDLDAITTMDANSMIWLNDGTAQFVDSQQLLTDLHPTSVAAADFDGDGDVDLFVTNSEGPNSVWLNDGTGAFTSNGQELGTALSLHVALGDLDGDGDVDAFVANDSRLNAEASAVWLNDGTGQFQLSGKVAAGSLHRKIELADLDQDGDLDAFVLSGDKESGPDQVWSNDGTGAFFDTGQELGRYDGVDVVLGDFDGDSDVDAFVTNATDQPSMLWLNDGAGAFYDGGQRLRNDLSGRIAAGDLDQDGDMDAVVSTEGESVIVWMNLSETVPGDFNGDGRVDIADVHQLCMQVKMTSENTRFDLDDSGAIDGEDVDVMITQLIGTTYGDANLDGRFDSSDLILVFQAGRYEDQTMGNSNWGTGDWNCDGDFNSSDLILAFQKGAYESSEPQALQPSQVDLAFAAARDLLDQGNDERTVAKKKHRLAQ